MPLLSADRVFETSTSTGTGTINLAGAVSGFQSFVSGIGNGNQCHYCIEDGVNWEVGIGTVTSGSPDTLSRTTVYDSSSGGALVNFPAGTKNVYVTIPAKGQNFLTLSHTFSSVSGSGLVSTNIAHSLGTDNYDFGFAINPSVGMNSLAAAVINAQGEIIEMGGTNVIASTTADTPAANNIRIKCYNGPSAQNITFKIWMRAR